jgi:hypothetical protein
LSSPELILAAFERGGILLFANDGSLPFLASAQHREGVIAMSYRTYYRGTDAVVTDRLFVWRTTPTTGYVIRDLRNVGLVRADGDRLRPYTTHVVVLVAVLAAAAWTVSRTPAAYFLGFLAVALPAVFAVAVVRNRPRRWELRANYRGHEVILYASSDVTRFNQVTRALRRAVEDARPPSGEFDLAAA